MRLWFWLCFSLCSPNYAGVLSEHLIKRYEVQERHPKGRTSPALHNTDLEQKKPRRKDSPALHMSPFAAGKRAGAGCLQGMMETGQDPYHLEVPRAWPLSWQSVLHGSALGEEQHFWLPFRFTLICSSPRADMEMGGGAETYSCFSKNGQIYQTDAIEMSVSPWEDSPAPPSTDYDPVADGWFSQDT